MGGVYIHIPFCLSKCPYCDFYSYRADENTRSEYVAALLDEINTGRRTAEYTDGSFKADTLYIGGGTPSVLKGEELQSIVNASRSAFSLPESAEITIECNPSSDIEAIAPFFKKCGVNRVSLGLQSAVDAERRQLGRTSNSERVKKAVSVFKENGIDNISLDIMLGIPSQTESSLTETLDFVLSAGVNHISAYILSIEKNTPFFKMKQNLSLPDEDAVCNMYDLCCDTLEGAGYEHYEISNFALPSFQSRHNIKYWILEDYLGIGAASHSFVDGRRFYYTRDAQSFIDGQKPVFDCDGGGSDEYIMLALRLTRGIDLTELKAKYGEEPYLNIIKKAPFLKEKGLLNIDDEFNNVSLTRKGILVSNSVISELI